MEKKTNAKSLCSLIDRLKGLPKPFQRGKLMFFLLGTASTIWFLIRVIPKPQRATYPCMRAAAPVMSGFVIYLITLGGSVLAFRKARNMLIRAKYVAAAVFFVVASISGIGFFLHNSKLSHAATNITPPPDGDNHPMGIARGIYPGRVTWAWDPTATKGNPTDLSKITFHFLAKYNNQPTYDTMMSKSILKLTGKTDIREAWDALFTYHNKRKGFGDVSYSLGEKIFIKINQVSSGYTTTEADTFGLTTHGYDDWKIVNQAATQTTPFVVLSMLRQMVNVYGVAQEDIYIGDPIGHIFKYNYDSWVKEFPDIHYVDKTTANWGRTLINPSQNSLVFYSDQETVLSTDQDQLFDAIENADYMINVANLKPHMRAGFSSCAKNHFGSHSRASASHLHPALIAPEEGDVNPDNITNGGYKKYRVLVDLMGNQYLGENTMLYVVDGAYGGSYYDNGGPAKWKMAPFNNNWCNSLFLSQDEVAIESVSFDFLRTEFNGINQGTHISPNWPGVDDYLHQAADKTNWPAGIAYAPNGDGQEIGSLGVHEHWNNAVAKQYIKDLYNDAPDTIGIDLVSIPDTLVKHKSEHYVTGIGSLHKSSPDELKTFPNPASNQVYFQLMMIGSDIRAEIIDMKGHRVYSENLKLTSSVETSHLDVSSVPNGTYLLNISNGTKKATCKICICR